MKKIDALLGIFWGITVTTTAILIIVITAILVFDPALTGVVSGQSAYLDDEGYPAGQYYCYEYYDYNAYPVEDYDSHYAYCEENECESEYYCYEHYDYNAYPVEDYYNQHDYNAYPVEEYNAYPVEEYNTASVESPNIYESEEEILVSKNEAGSLQKFPVYIYETETPNPPEIKSIQLFNFRLFDVDFRCLMSFCMTLPQIR